MFEDILDRNNYICVNIKLAKIIGLKSAVYCFELISIYEKAKKKNKLLNGTFFKVDRNYIYNQTTLTMEDQTQIDINLSKMNILVKDTTNPNILQVDFQLLASLIANDDLKLVENLSSKFSLNNKQTKKQAIIKNLKDNIVCSNYELATTLRDWIDSLFEVGKVLSKKTVTEFQNTLFAYTKDIDIAIKIVNIAAANGYRDCSWAIQLYEQNKKQTFKTTQKTLKETKTIASIANKEDLSSIIF